MPTYSPIFERSTAHAMIYEIGPNFNPNDKETAAGLISTAAQRKKVGYVNDPLDAGGETKYGVAKNGNPTLNIRTLTWDQAKEVYYTKYWIAGGCHLLSDKVAMLHYDGCINLGVSRASKFLQQVAGVTQDGQVGPKTAAAINSMNQKNVLEQLCAAREQFYRNIVANKPTQVRFLNGWLRRISEMRDYVLNTA